ncbi:hypothetical protein I302_103248 [Kwoniella bestiolae CBS 10118]|uniref:Major facilitator superfamily (MFS) profile domain-containing protein n=1 Tax=Kwoniella bestiolae CBS 10118 TaxID=1296100 RepID=A0A1B9G7W7_9TREE|nr:hypothetical protein I302_01947 [Kwoniella bestiolae CBS 10118]OCF27112.1 hypothetical protein I302_01947 [Kwoniella bestiolae CBS 10118]
MSAQADDKHVVPMLGGNPPIRSPEDTTAHDDKVSNNDDKDESDAGDGIAKKEPISLGSKSKGVIEMEALQAKMNLKWRIILYTFFMFAAYSLSLDQSTATVYLNYAVSKGFKLHSLQASVSVVSSIFSAMAPTPIAKCADYFGRIYAEAACLIFYVVGQALMASANGIVQFSAGSSIHTLGIAGIFMLHNIIISDISSLRNRYWWHVAPAVPQVFNSVLGADVAKSMLGYGSEFNSWRWGIAMFCILIPPIILPILATLWIGTRPEKAIRQDLKVIKRERAARLPLRERFWIDAKDFFWKLDVIGLALFVAGIGLFLVTLTLANSKFNKWSDAHTIAQLVVGVLLTIGFAVWERWFAPIPMVPFALMKRRTIVGCCLIALIYPLAGRCVGTYLYTYIQVAANQSQLSATRITNFPSIGGWVTAVMGALIARRFRFLKPIIIFGLALQTLATGLMLRYRTSHSSQGELAVIQVLRGASTGFISYPVQALLQAAAPHEHLAIVTAGWLAIYYVAMAIGSAIAGAMWTNIVPDKLEEYLQGNATLAASAYKDPLTYATKWKVGTWQRDGVAHAQDDAQRAMVITGTCLSFVGLLVAIFVLENLRLTDDVTLKESEEYITNQEKKQKKAMTVAIARDGPAPDPAPTH